MSGTGTIYTYNHDDPHGCIPGSKAPRRAAQRRVPSPAGRARQQASQGERTPRQVDFEIQFCNWEKYNFAI